MMVLIYGQSGSGKSCSLRNLKDACIISCVNKPLPFRPNATLEVVKIADTPNMVRDVKAAIEQTKKKTIIIDDAGYILSKSFMRRILEKGYEKFSEMGDGFYKVLAMCECVPDDTNVYVMMHADMSPEGTVKPKVLGKVLDDKVCVEGLFTIVLRTLMHDGAYYFETRTDGVSVSKTPLGMFNDTYIDNDVAALDEVIRTFYDYTTEPKTMTGTNNLPRRRRV